MNALGGLARVDARVAGQADLVDREERAARDLVAHADQARVKSGVRGERGDREQRGLLHAEQGGDGLVEEPRVDVGGFLRFWVIDKLKTKQRIQALPPK